MESVSHREMRNNSGDVLRRVEEGESLVITNRGRRVAVISPLKRNPLDELVEHGQVRPAVSEVASLATISRATSTVSSAEIITDLRGSR